MELLALEWQATHHLLGDEDRDLLDDHFPFNIFDADESPGQAHPIDAHLRCDSINQLESVVSRALVRHRTARGAAQVGPVRRLSSAGEPLLAQCSPDCPCGGADARSLS